MAAVHKFRVPNSFPDPGTLRSCFRKYGNHNRAIVDAFLNWINVNNEKDVSFRFHSRMFMHYCPMMELFDYSTHYNSGIGRETVYMLHLPSFAQLSFRNYYTEVFVHVINFTAKWPLAFWRLVSLNSCINLTGKYGKGIELDAWVESRIVKPTEKAVSGRTVKTCT